MMHAYAGEEATTARAEAFSLLTQSRARYPPPPNPASLPRSPAFQTPPSPASDAYRGTSRTPASPSTSILRVTSPLHAARARRVSRKKEGRERQSVRYVRPPRNSEFAPSPRESWAAHPAQSRLQERSHQPPVILDETRTPQTHDASEPITHIFPIEPLHPTPVG